MQYADDFLIERQAGPVYDGHVSRVKRKSSLIYRIQCGRTRIPIWYRRSGRAGPQNSEFVCFHAAATEL